MCRATKFVIITLASCCVIRGLIQTAYYLYALYVVSLLDGYDMDHVLPDISSLVPDDQKLLLELDQVFTRMKKLRDNLLDYSHSIVLPLTVSQLSMGTVWLILSSLTLYAVLRNSPTAFKWLHGIVAFRLFTSSIFWFVNCGLQFDFGQTFTMQYMGLINENLQSELCQKFDILWIIDNANIFFRDFGPVDSKILNKVFEIQVNYDLRFADLLSFWLWIKLYQLWSKSQDEITNRPKKAKTVKSGSTKSFKNSQKDTSETKVDLIWLWHSCLYGHKENLKKILLNFSNLIKINETRVNGNTALHLGIFGNHLPVTQILLGKFGKELNLSIRNNDGLNPLDLAVVKKNSAIIKLVCKHTKPEVSSLVHAVETDQPDMVIFFREKLGKLLQKHSDLTVPLQRFIDLSKEVEMKNTSKERREVCKGNLEVYKKHICSNLRKSYYAGGVGNQICVSKEVAVTENNALNSEIDLTEENYAAEELKEVLSEFECPVCFEIMMPPKRIYSCSNDHYICSLCLTDTKMKACPLCREDFTVTRPCIRHTSERFLTRFLQKS